jgi:hypothetical protein
MSKINSRIILTSKIRLSIVEVTLSKVNRHTHTTT